MQLESVTLRGFGPFRETVSVDFGALGEALLVAVKGENGAGKTTLLELAGAGALYRSMPTRGTLKSLAVSRDAMLETTVMNGQRYTLRHLVDNISGKSEAVALDGEGRPLYDSSKVSDFESWAAKALPSPDVTFATVFSAQGAGGFLAAKPGERKSILLRALGIEALEGLADRARTHRRETAAALDTLTARIADERARGGDVQALEAELARARQSAASAEVSAKAARTILETARQQAAECAQAERDYRAALERRAKLRAEIEQARGQLTDLERRVANNRAVLDEGDSIRAAAAELEGRRKQLAEAQVGIERQRADVATWRSKLASLESQLEAARRRINQAMRRVGEGEAARDAEHRLPSVERSFELTERAVRITREKVEELQGKSLAGADERIRDLRTGLQAIARPETSMHPSGSLPNEIATEVLRQDDAAVETARVFPERVRAAKQVANEAESKLRTITAERDKLRQLAAGVDAAKQAERDVDEAMSEIETLTADISSAREQLAHAQRIAEVGRESIAYIESAIATLEPIAAKFAPLQNAEARLAELDPQRAELAARLETLDRELTDTPEPLQPSPAPDVSAFARDVETAETALRKAEGDALMLEGSLQRARESAERLAALESELKQANAELADWTRLAEDLGPKGLQLTLIDSAGPEITETANALLRECHGTRFSVRVETQRLSSDKKRLIDGCDVMVLDSENGREASGETFSGGERVIIGEALSLALTIVACRRSGVQGVTLVRDETAGQLSPENARAYLGMLRQAADLVSASRVLFVAHDPALWEMADRVIEVSGGQVRVQ